MSKDIYVKSSILQDFRIFYREILLLKDSALGHITPQKEQEEEGEKETKEPSSLLDQSITYPIRRRLESILASQYKEISNQSYVASYYREAQYIMVALADEIFINLKWRGNEEWKDNLLESLIYNTQDSGDKFFENLDRFLETSNSKSIDMASLYLIALGLGFKGKYRGTNSEEELWSYKKKLYRYIAGDDLGLLENKTPLFSQTYKNIISDRQHIIIPDSRPWWVSLSIISIGFVGLSSLIWFTHMNDFSSLINTLEKWSKV